jgi:pimeloyl-ACP methyl ester carboxylesterase
LSRPGFWRKPHKPTPRRASISVFNGVPKARHPALYETLVPESGRAAFELGFWYLDRSRASDVDHAAVQCPVYVVSCGRDRLTPAPVVRKVAALYPGAALRHFPQRGHWVIDDDDTEDMVNDMLTWLRALERRTQARGLRRA